MTEKCLNCKIDLKYEFKKDIYICESCDKEFNFIKDDEGKLVAITATARSTCEPYKSLRNK